MGEIFKSPMPFDVTKVQNVSIIDYLFPLLRKYLPDVGDKPWMVDTTAEKKVLFKDVEDRTKRVASALTRRGFGHGDFLYYVAHDIADMAILQLAVWMLGGATRGGFHEESPEEFARQMNDIKCKFVAIDAETAPNVKKALDLVDFKCALINMEDLEVESALSFDDFVNDDGSALPLVIKINPKEDTLLVCNTSGSTGAPKGVIQNHFATVAVLSSFEGMIAQSHDEDQFVTSHNYSISNIWTAIMQLATGNTMYCMGRFAREKLADHLLKYKPAKFMLYPYLAAWFTRSPGVDKFDFNFVKHILLGGSVLDATTAELMEKLFPNAFLNQVYASTETLGVSITLNGKAKVPIYNTSPDGERLVSSGFLFPLVEAKVTDLETDDLLGRNKLGKLRIRSQHVMTGYLVPGGEPDRSDFDKDGWFDTGDMAFFDDYGQLFVRERASFAFKYFFHFVHPSEIEAVLQEHPSVQMSCVIGVPNVETNYLAKAFVVLKEGKSASREELLQLVTDKMSIYKQLHGGLEFVESLPENRGGKLDRVAVWRKHCRRN